MRLLLFGGFYFGKMWKILEKRPFFRADMAGLGKYCTGGYGRIGVYRVKLQVPLALESFTHTWHLNPLHIHGFLKDVTSKSG